MDRIEDQSAVTLRLKIVAQLPEGEERNPQESQFEFIFGVEHQVPSLEKVLQGAEAGYRFSILVPPEELYGIWDPQLVREIPKEGLIKQRVRKGRYYRQIKMGSLIEFKILEIRDDTVLVDFNKPTAGISALMEGEVLGIRKPSDEEISTARDEQRKKEIGCG